MMAVKHRWYFGLLIVYSNRAIARAIITRGNSDNPGLPAAVTAISDPSRGEEKHFGYRNIVEKSVPSRLETIELQSLEHFWIRIPPAMTVCNITVLNVTSK